MTWSKMSAVKALNLHGLSFFTCPRTRTSKVMGAVEVGNDENVLPILEAYIKGQRICKVYVDGGAQVCVMSQKIMHCLGLEVQGKSEFQSSASGFVEG